MRAEKISTKRLIPPASEYKNMKKLVIKTIAYLMILALMVLTPSIIIDPYNVFHVSEPRDNGIESNKSFIKTEYIKRNHENIDSLVFGSSRAGFVDISYLNEKTGCKFYDMASSECLVSEQVTELRELIKSGFIPKQVLVMVDDISCFVDPALHENMLYRVSYPAGGLIDKTEFYLKYCDLITNFESIKVIKEDKEKKALEAQKGVDNSFDASTGLTYLDRFYNTGTERLDKISQFDPNEEQYQKGYWVDYYSYRVNEALKDMADMKALCDSNGIKLTVVTNPLYHLTYEMDLEAGYIDYLRGLAEITDYYNFSSFSDVTEDYKYYYETSHFTPQVTRMMVDSMTMTSEVYGEGDDVFSLSELNSKGFGVHVDDKNVDDVINLLVVQAGERGINVKTVEN